MADVNTDLITRTFDTVNPNVALVTQDRSSLDMELKCNNLAGWPNGETVHFSTYKLDTEGEVDDDTQIDWKGIVNQSTHTITNLKRVAGAPDGGNDVNDVVEMMPTAKWADELAQAVLKTHEKNGDLKSGVVKADNIENGAIGTAKMANGSVITDTLADSAVTYAKLSTDTFKVDPADGWTRYDYPKWVEYVKTSTHSVNLASGASSKYLIGAFIATLNPWLADKFDISVAALRDAAGGMTYGVLLDVQNTVGGQVRAQFTNAYNSSVNLGSVKVTAALRFNK